MGQGTVEQAEAAQWRHPIVARLRRHAPDLEKAILSRVTTLLRSQGELDPEYVAGVKEAICIGIDYAIHILDGAHRSRVPVPPQLLSQARLAAGAGVQLDQVLNRYTASYNLLVDQILAEASHDSACQLRDVQQVLRHQATHFEHLVEAVSAEYKAEVTRRFSSPAVRRAAQVRDLLSGKLIDTRTLSYEFEAWHLGLIADGSAAAAAVRVLSRHFKCPTLTIAGADRSVWAWLGNTGDRGISSQEVEQVARRRLDTDANICLGEPSFGLNGWRLTHKQALALHVVSKSKPGMTMRYADQALVASMAQDELLMASLKQMYLAPLETERDGGERLKMTLRAYFDAQSQISSTAAALRVTRKTVSSRLGRVEAHLGRPLSSCAAELQAALALDRSIGAHFDGP